MLSADDQNSFLDAILSAGLQAHGNQGLEADGKIHRYRVEGDKSGSENGWYVLYSDGAVPAGAFGSWKTGYSQNWCAKSERTLSPSEREEWRRKQLDAQQARETAIIVVRQQAREKALKLLDIAKPAAADSGNGEDGESPAGVHPYLLTKGIKPYGVKVLKDSLVVPLRNASGVITSLQFIQEDGSKKFLTGGEITGSYYAIGKPCGTLLICEGYATGASLYDATGHAVAVAFNAGNLAAVARVMREKFPEHTIIICADNDVGKDTNTGLNKAGEAAGQIHGMLAYAKFQESALIDGKVPTDFNDLHRLQGLEAVRAVIDASSKTLPVDDGAGGEDVRALFERPTRQSLAQLIDETDDFDVLTGDLVMRVANAGLVKPALEYLISKIAKKSGTTKASLFDVIRSFSDSGSGKGKVANELDGRIDELNEKHAILPMGGRILVLNREYDPVMEKQLLTFSAKTDFETRYCNRKMFDRGEEVGLGTYWINHPRRAEYDGMVFSPGQDQPGYLNLWTGWGIEPRAGSCKKYLEFIFDVIASGDAALFNYIIYWCAHLVQRPQELPETALVFRGREGIGKDTFIRPLRDIVGSEHFLMLSSLNQITGRFSGHLSNALLVFCNESVWGGDKSAQGVLKSMITDEVQPIEHKGRDLFMVRSYRRMIFATNENWAVPRGADDRRYVITDVSDTRKGDYEYFKAIREEMKNGGTAALMAYLLEVNIADWHPRQIPEALQVCGWELKIRSGGSIVQWWFDILQKGWLKKMDAHYAEKEQLLWPDNEDDPCLTEEVQQSYLNYCMAYKITHPEVASVVGHQLKDWGITRKRKKVKSGGDSQGRAPCYLLPSLETAQDIFSNRFSIPVEVWGRNDDADS